MMGEGKAVLVSLMGIWVLLLSERSGFWNSYINLISHKEAQEVSISLKKNGENLDHMLVIVNDLWASVLAPNISRFLGRRNGKGTPLVIAVHW